MSDAVRVVPNLSGRIMEVADLSVSYGDRAILSQIDMTVMSGEILAIIGPNGAGKSTLFGCLSGLIGHYQGAVRFRERALHGLTPNRIVALGLARTFQSARLFANLSIIENVEAGYAAAQRNGLLSVVLGRQSEMLERQAVRRAAETLLERYAGSELYQRRHGSILGLSTGQERILEIIRAMMSNPSLLLLDEPMAGLSPVWIEQVIALIRAARADGLTLCLIEHNMRVVLELADRVIVLQDGRVLMEGEPAAVRSDPRLSKAYFG